MHHRCKLDLGFNISISVRERAARQGIEKHNLSLSCRPPLISLCLLAAKMKKKRRRREGSCGGDKELIWQLLSIFSRLFFNPAAAAKCTRFPSEPVIWQYAGEVGLNPDKADVKYPPSVTIQKVLVAVVAVVGLPGNTCPATLSHQSQKLLFCSFNQKEKNCIKGVTFCINVIVTQKVTVHATFKANAWKRRHWHPYS